MTPKQRDITTICTLTAAQVGLLCLKLTSLITCSWWVVFVPVYLFLLSLVIVLIALVYIASKFYDSE